MNIDNDMQQQPVIRQLRDFDKRSGNLAERALFNPVSYTHLTLPTTPYV